MEDKQEERTYRGHDPHCLDCFYYQGWSSFDLSCNYIFIEGKRRPCPPGKGCTEKIPRDQKRKL